MLLGLRFIEIGKGKHIRLRDAIQVSNDEAANSDLDREQHHQLLLQTE